MGSTVSKGPSFEWKLLSVTEHIYIYIYINKKKMIRLINKI